MPFLSAHRGGTTDPTKENSREAFENACTLPCDFIEFDVHRSADGEFVINHDAELVTSDGSTLRIATSTLAELREVRAVVTLREVCEMIAAARKLAHVDFKFVGHEIDAMQIILDELSPSDFVITTRYDISLRRIALAYPDTKLLLGLSLGGRRGMLKLADRYAFEQRLRFAHANVIVAQQDLARDVLANHARRTKRLLLVWTPSSAYDLSMWMNDPRAWLVTTNDIAKAIEVTKG